MQMVYTVVRMIKKASGTPDKPETDADKSSYVTVRIPRTLYEEVEELLPVFAEHPLVKASGRISASLALRLALLRGISVIRDESSAEKGGAADE